MTSQTCRQKINSWLLLILCTYSGDDIERVRKLNSVSKYDYFSRRYSGTNVDKSAILLLKIEENGRFLEI